MYFPFRDCFVYVLRAKKVQHRGPFPRRHKRVQLMEKIAVDLCRKKGKENKISHSNMSKYPIQHLTSIYRECMLVDTSQYKYIGLNFIPAVG